MSETKPDLPRTEHHEFTGTKMCTFGDGGYYYHDGADRATCACGWESAPVVRDKTALVLLWQIHARREDARARVVWEAAEVPA